MSHEKVFGFCENLCETEVEQISNKVTGISSSSTDDQYPSAKAVYDTFEKTSNKVTHVQLLSSSTDEQYASAKAVYNALELFLSGGDNEVWVSTPNGSAMWYYYESANTTTYNLPTANCIVLVFKRSGSRGVAFAYGWDGASTNKTIWKNTCHDAWRGWAQLHTN